METPRVNDLLEKLLKERGEVCERNAPESWVKLARNLEREMNDWREKYTTLNRELCAELRDPNGTIWEHAERLQKENDELKSRIAAIPNGPDERHSEPPTI